MEEYVEMVEKVIQTTEVVNNPVEFNVYIYNVQPGITIDYATGNSSLVK